MNAANPLSTYIFLIFLLTLTPGADTMLVLKNVFSSGKRAGINAAFGISCGLLVYAFLTALGISLIFSHSPFIFKVIKTFGAGYLIYLGIQALLSLKKLKSNIEITKAKQKKSGKKAFTEGLLSNLFNPKIAVFYLTVLPQFINPSDNIFLKSLFLTGIHIVMGIIWLISLSLFIGSIKYFYNSAKIRIGLEALCGGVMLIFGIILLLE